MSSLASCPPAIPADCVGSADWSDCAATSLPSPASDNIPTLFPSPRPSILTAAGIGTDTETDADAGAGMDADRGAESEAGIGAGGGEEIGLD